MTALLERLNASRRFARSVYAPHKLALRQGVPSPLRAVGLTAPAAPVLSASRSIAPRAVSVATRAAALPSAVLRPNPAALEPQDSVNLEPQGSANLEPQVSNDLEPQDSVNLESLREAAFPAESPLLESAQEQILELAAPVEIAPSEPLESNNDVAVQALTEQTLLEQPVVVNPLARVDPVRVEASAELEPSAEPIQATESQTPAITAPDAPAANPLTRAITATEPVGETTISEPPLEFERVEAAQPMSDTLVASPAQPLESQPAIPEPVRLERQPAAPDLEVTKSAQDAATLEPATLEASPAPIAVEPERIAPSVAVNLEATAPIVAAPSAADQPIPDPIQPPARGRVIEEFQARPPRNMPPRHQPPRAAEPEPATVSATPLRSPEEWARLLRQRFAQPGDEAFDDAITPAAPAALEVAPLEPAFSNSGAPAASLEPRANTVVSLLEGQAALITPAAGSSEAESIRERSLAALQAIPEDMTKRSPRDWGLALIRRYTSADEAAAIGIEVYRDPNDPAALQTPPSEPAHSLAARATVDSPVSSSPVLSSPEQAVPIGLESALHPARRFVAPRVVNSTTSSSRTVTASPIAPVQAQTARAQPAQRVALQRSPAIPTPLEQSSNVLEAAPQLLASLEPSRSTSAPLVSPRLEQPDPTVDAPPQPTLETEDLTAPQADALPAEVNDAQFTRAALGERPASEIVRSADVAPSNTVNLEPVMLEPEAVNPEPAMLEPVTLSGATRRFLEPLVGFDPNEVNVYTGEGASRVTRDLRADAAAQHGAVLLPDASNLETPAQLGLLAHELIHVAQQQSAPQLNASSEATPASPFQASPLERARPFEAVSRRFVPALGSSDTRGAAQLSSAAQPNTSQFSNAVRQSSAPINAGISNFASEEERARAAEARVTQIARAGPLSATPASTEATNAPASWNGLPAPWESLPSFESSSSDDGVVSLIGAGLSPQSWGGSATANSSGYGGSVSSSNPSASSSSVPSSSASSGSASNSSASQAAETGRELPSEGAGASAAPDLEQLAKQVYDVLKRRLQSDRRRGGL